MSILKVKLHFLSTYWLLVKDCYLSMHVETLTAIFEVKRKNSIYKMKSKSALTHIPSTNIAIVWPYKTLTVSILKVKLHFLSTYWLLVKDCYLSMHVETLTAIFEVKRKNSIYKMKSKSALTHIPSTNIAIVWPYKTLTVSILKVKLHFLSTYWLSINFSFRNKLY